MPKNEKKNEKEGKRKVKRKKKKEKRKGVESFEKENIQKNSFLANIFMYDNRTI